ncbi:MAG: sugar ABC transporter permease [Alkaliphilus sp.]|nr:MAG: sugar ABC transporter permease [Alkaliphilus sp.]
MRKIRFKKWGFEIFGVLLALLYLSPFYIILTNSLKSKRNVLVDTLGWPEEIMMENYFMAWDRMNFMQTFFNSLIITIVSVLVITVFSSMAAWVLVRTKNKTSSVIFYTFVGAMLIPFQAVMLPLVSMMGPNNLNLINTRYGIIFLYLGFGASLSIFLYHGFIKNIPTSLEEAAIIDGCSTWQVFYHIIFPLLKPITVTVAILNSIWIWNDFLLPSLVLQEKSVRTIPLQMQFFFGAFSKDWHLAMAALALSIIPIIIFYIFAQKHIIAGVTAGSGK